jgi:hypothetical protein
MICRQAGAVQTGWPAISRAAAAPSAASAARLGGGTQVRVRLENVPPRVKALV